MKNDLYNLSITKQCGLMSTVSYKDLAQCFENAWNKFLRDYRKNGRYCFGRTTPEKSAEDFGHYWSERDVHANLTNFVKREIKGLSKVTGRGFEVHLDVLLKRKYFRILKGTGLKKSPIIDIVVALPLEGDEGKPFSLFAEIKYWQHLEPSIPRQFGKTGQKWLRYDIDKLSKLMHKNVCKTAYFCFLDEYYTSNLKTKREVEQFLKQKEAETNVKCLYAGICYSEWVKILRKRILC